MSNEPSDAKLLIDFLLAHPGAIATISGSIVAIAASYGGALAAGWRVSSYLNNREMEDQKRQIANMNAEYQRNVARLETQAETRSLLDGDFPSVGELQPIDIPYLGKTAEYHRDFNIALAQAQPESLWTFKQTSPQEVFSEWFGSSLTENPHLREGYGLISGGHEEPCLLWKGAREVRVENSDVMKQMYPFVMVRSIRHEAGRDPTTEELFNFIDWLRMWDKAMPNARFEVIKMHRTQHRAYLRGYFRFLKLMIGENSTKSAKEYDEYYLMRQIFVFRSDMYTTIISTGLPNRELLNDPYYKPLNEWWHALRLIKTPSR